MAAPPRPRGMGAGDLACHLVPQDDASGVDNSRLQISQAASSSAATGGQRAVQCLAQETPRRAWADHVMDTHMMAMAASAAGVAVARWSLRYSFSGSRFLASNGPEILTACPKRLQQTKGNGPTNSNSQHQAVATQKTTVITDGCLLAFSTVVAILQQQHRLFGKEDHYL